MPGSASTPQERELQLKQLQLDSMLEVTQAINSSLSEEALYKIYHFTLLGQLAIRKVALYVHDSEDKWVCKLHFGTPFDFQKIALPEALYEVQQSSVPLEQLPLAPEFNVFKQALPIIHNGNTLAIVLIDNSISETDDQLDLRFVQTLTNIIMVAIENRRLARKQIEQEAIRKELEIAKEVQNMLFPKSLPNNDLFSLFASYIPHHSIGGDYYDYVPVDNDRFLFCVADVSGKGVPASLLMSNFQAGLRSLLLHESTLEGLVRNLNSLIYQNATGEKFITSFMGIYDSRTRELTYVNAGHNPPILLEEDNACLFLSEGCTMLGIVPELPFVEMQSLTVKPRSILLCYTDGLTEAFNSEEEEFGVENTVRFLKRCKHHSSERLHSELLRQVDNYKSSTAFDDDVTLLTCRFK